MCRIKAAMACGPVLEAIKIAHSAGQRAGAWKAVGLVSIRSDLKCQ